MKIELIIMAYTKRYTVPKSWPIRVKENKYVVSPLAGPHSKETCIPLGLILRDMLKHAHTMKEAMQILNQGTVKINGITRKHRGFPVGLMDVVDVGGDFYRMLPTSHGLRLLKTSVTDAGLRLARIKNKGHVKKKKLQLNFHDGSNMLVDKDTFKTSDVVVIDIATKKIKDVIKFEKGAFAIVIDGHNAGANGKIENIDRKLKTVTLDSDGRKFPVPIRYIFVVGQGGPAVKLGEERKEVA